MYMLTVNVLYRIGVRHLISQTASFKSAADYVTGRRERKNLKLFLGGYALIGEEPAERTYENRTRPRRHPYIDNA